MSRRRKKEAENDSKNINGKKSLVILLIAIVVLSGIGASSVYMLLNHPSGGYVVSEEDNGGSGGGIDHSGDTTIIDGNLRVRYSPISGISKKVLGELFVTTTCPYCAKTESDLSGIEGQRDDFYFVTFVADKNREAYTRYTEISRQQGTPDTEFDGGYRSELGAVDSSAFISDIEECKARQMPPVEIEVSYSKSGGTASLSIDVSVGSSDFNGVLRAFVIDKNSPWLNINDQPIPNAFVGYLFNTEIGTDTDTTGRWGVDGYKSFSELAVVIAVYDSDGYVAQVYRIDL